MKSEQDDRTGYYTLILKYPPIPNLKNDCDRWITQNLMKIVFHHPFMRRFLESSPGACGGFAKIQK
ncbi:hypothetical protein NIES593_16725 [Hydrococcus rivularis NIES-593]|uniref:Uncharacterized protein n=1 Tax=Hydrococcus rivularis NIES-593 TaxID=1921803 RepID=A0A1U7HBW8_9CYAN|nr:hypothetical protein NIES593_16725 [Hydrococcus rivularis NIES-593]